MDTLSVSDYQAGTEVTAIYREGVGFAVGIGGFIENWSNLAYVSLGLAGEAGELAGEVKKAVRDDNGLITDERRETLFKELGDCCWYVSQIATELGFKLEDVMDYNLTKLSSRQERGVLGGSGDER